MSRRTNQQALKFWFPYWNNPAQTPSPERTQPQRSSTQSRSSTSRQPTAPSGQRSQPSDSPSSSRRPSLPTNTSDPTRKQLPPKSNAATKPSSPARLPSNVKVQDPIDSLGKPVERAALVTQPSSFKETKPTRDDGKKPDETKAAEIPKVEQTDSSEESEPKRNQGESSEEGAIVKTHKSDSNTKVKQNKVEEEEAKPANLQPQPQTEPSNQHKSNEQKQHDKTQNIPEVPMNQKEIKGKPLRISEDESIPDLVADRGTYKTETKTEVLGQAHSNTNETALNSKVEREYKINGDEADERQPKNGRHIHAAKENMIEKGSTSANVPKEHGSNGKGSKVSISTGPWVAFADGERADFQKEIKEGLSKLVGKLNIGYSGTRHADSVLSIITLAGKNKGAIMKIGKGNAKGTKKSKDEIQHNDERLETAATVNSNVQSINNSLLNESKYREESPGVHLVRSAKPTDGTGLRKKIEMLVSRSRSLSIPTSHKLLSYQPPNVRRRCLRGLMMESSEDEEDGAEKPRRHGCRVGVGCGDKSKEKEGTDEIISKP